MFAVCQVLSVISSGFTFLVLSRIGVACAHSICLLYTSIADPVSAVTRETIRAGYEEIYSALKPFEKSEYTINDTNGKTMTESIMKGVTSTVNRSTSKTTTHTVTKGTNSSHTVGGSVGVNGSISKNTGVHAGAQGFGVSAGSAVTVGASVSADYHYMYGHHEDKSLSLIHI